MSRGSSLEKLVIASQQSVLITQVKGEVVRIAGGKMFQKLGPVDFFGLYKPTGTLMVFDCKECALKHRLNTSETHLPEHQRQQLIRYGDAGAIAGVLAESTANRRLYWLDWTRMLARSPSYQWDDLLDIGSSGCVVNWSKVWEAFTQLHGGSSAAESTTTAKESR